MGFWGTKSRVLVLALRNSPVPSIQTYMHCVYKKDVFYLLNMSIDDLYTLLHLDTSRLRYLSKTPLLVAPLKFIVSGNVYRVWKIRRKWRAWCGLGELIYIYRLGVTSNWAPCAFYTLGFKNFPEGKRGCYTCCMPNV